MKLSVFILFFLVLVSCSFATHEKYLQRINRWKGQPEEAIVEHLGAPSKFYELNGIRYLTYSGGRTNYVPQTVSSNVIGNSVQTQVYGGYTVNRWCSTTYVVEKGIIVDVTFKGNDCTAH